MTRERQYHFERAPLVPKRWLAAAAALLLLAASLYLLLAKPGVNVSIRSDPSTEPPGLRLDVQTHGSALRFDLPRLSASAPLHDGRASLRLGDNDLPPGRSELAYVLREPWYRPDRRGTVTVNRPSRPVDYVLRVEPDGVGGARLSVSGDPGNYVLVIDPAGGVALSGRLAEIADARGAATVTFSKQDLERFAGQGTPAAKVSVTSPAGDVDKRTVTLLENPSSETAARVASVEIVSGRGDHVAPQPLPSFSPQPEQPASPTPAAAPGKKKEAPPAGIPSTAEQTAPPPAPPVSATPHPPPQAAPTPGKTQMPPPEAPPASRAPAAETTQNLASNPSGWVRDRALESELAGRGVAGVQIFRNGRSLKLRGFVANDFMLRTLYQFVNDKGFGEVDYGVEVR
jgi:hypothetical protein